VTLPACTRCGECCRQAPCLLGIAKYGLHVGPCRGLRFVSRWRITDEGQWENAQSTECSIFADTPEGPDKEALRRRLAIEFGCRFKETANEMKDTQHV
jgi:hypothetical protein